MLVLLEKLGGYCRPLVDGNRQLAASQLIAVMLTSSPLGKLIQSWDDEH
jgi:hypothetical protein